MSYAGGARRGRRWIAASVATSAVGVLIAASCTTRPPTWPPTTTRPTTPTTDGHGHTEHDHHNLTSTTRTGGTPTTDGHGHTEHDHHNLTSTTAGHGHGGGCDFQNPGHSDHPGGGGDGHHVGYDHAPTEAQKQCAKDHIIATRRAVKAKGLTSKAALQRAGYFSIGDAMTGTDHWVHAGYHRDGKQLDPNAIEAFAIRNNRVVAAMYVLDNGKTRADIPDVAGNWTMWHDHNLPFGSGNPSSDDFYRLKFIGGVMRQTAPMLHEWLIPNSCGPFAGTDTTNMTGGCTPEAEPGTDFLY